MPTPPISEQLNKKDLELIIEVNRKAIEVETAVADQNEEIIDHLNKSNTSDLSLHDKADKNAKQHEEIIKKIEELNKEIFKMQVLFITGLLGFIVQIVSLFVKK